MYSERLRQLFRAAVHAGRLEAATHYGEGGSPGGGPHVCLWLHVKDGVVREARFKTYGCPAAIACAEAACAWAEGRRLTDLAGIAPDVVAQWVDGVPEGKEHCPALTARTLAGVRQLRPPPAPSGPAFGMENDS